MGTNNAINLNATGVAYYNGTGLFSAPTITNFALVVGSTANNIGTPIAVGATGTILLGNTGANPSFSTVGTAGTILIGTSTVPTFSGTVTLTALTVTTLTATTLNLVNPLGVPSGGSGTSTLAAHNVLLGEGTATLGLAAPTSTAGIALVSTGAASDPSFGTVTPAGGGTGVASPTAHTLPVAEGSSAFTFLGPLGNGQLLIGSTGADPVPATIQPGTGISITVGAGTITINATGGGISWNDVTTTSTTMASNNGYIADNAALVTLTLPPTASLSAAPYGDRLEIVGKGAGGWSIAQNANQIIQFGSVPTTAGTGGSLSSTNQYDSIVLIYVGIVSGNATFIATAAQGNITVV